MDQGARPGPRPPAAQYETVRPDMRLGDLLLFRGKGAVSSLIQRGTGSPYSDAGAISLLGTRFAFIGLVRLTGARADSPPGPSLSV